MLRRIIIFMYFWCYFVNVSIQFPKTHFNALIWHLFQMAHTLFNSATIQFCSFIAAVAVAADQCECVYIKCESIYSCWLIKSYCAIDVWPVASNSYHIQIRNERIFFLNGKLYIFFFVLINGNDPDSMVPYTILFIISNQGCWTKFEGYVVVLFE